MTRIFQYIVCITIVNIFSACSEKVISRQTRQAPLEIPEECKKGKYCEKVPNYPDEIVNALVNQIGEDVKYLSRDTIDDQNTRRVDTDTQVRIPLCEAKEQLITPQLLLDENGEWRTVINPTAHPVQKFRAVLCENENNECTSSIAPLLQPPGLQTKCVQKFASRVILALDKNEEKIEKVVLQVPSCCQCELYAFNNRK